MVNPYDPQNPVKPDVFGGRKPVLDAVRERIEKAVDQKQSGGVLVFGYRGIGKTSVLNKIKSMVSGEETDSPKNILAIYRRLSKTTTETDLYRIIVETLVDEIKQKRTLIEKLTEVPGRISSAKVMNIALDFDREWETETPFLRWKATVRNIKNAECIVIELDDADFLTLEALGELKTIVEETKNTPVLLVVSGGVEFEERLVADYSPISRIFSGASFNLGAFKLEETKEVLLKPLVNNTSAWTEDGMRCVHELSGGYPYLVQCMASASYKEGGTMDSEAVRTAIPKALEIGRPWLSHELEDASDNDIASFEKIIKSGKTILKSSEMSRFGIAPPYIDRLVKLKVLKKINRGRYALEKPPIIGYYHVLKRGLQNQQSV